MYKRRYLALFRAVALLNPDHKPFYLPGYGMIAEQWGWCLDNLNTIKLLLNDREGFREYALPLIRYIRKKRDLLNA